MYAIKSEKKKYSRGTLYRSLGFQEVVVPGFTDNRFMKVVRLSVEGTGRMKYSWYSFLLEAESTPGP